jgi:hypothetical protein
VVIGDGAAAVMPAVPLAVAAGPSKGGSAKFQPASRQNAVRIFENTVLGFDKLTAMDTGAEVVSETQLDLKAGHILGNVRKLSPGSRYEIKLPNGVAGVRGTVFHLWADGRLDVLNGGVVSSTVDPKGTVQTRDVIGGQSYNPTTDRILPLPPTTAQWMQNTVQGMSVVSFAPAAVTLDQTTYYVQPVISPTDGTPADNNGERK